MKTLEQANIFCAQIEANNAQALADHKLTRWERLADESIAGWDKGVFVNVSAKLNTLFAEYTTAQLLADFALMQLIQIKKAA